MNRLKMVLVSLVFALVSGCSGPQGSAPAVASEPEQPSYTSNSPGDMADLIDAGLVKLLRSNGNGNSSGAAVEGSIQNTSSKPLAIDIVMSRPVYFRNGGRGQNMIASMVLGDDGGYMSNGSNSFVQLAPNEQANVQFIAFCADFEKDNPSASDTFTLGDPPPQLLGVMSKIAAYSRANPESDVTVPGQVAVWMAQGVPPDTIRTKFDFDAMDEARARSFLE